MDCESFLSAHEYYNRENTGPIIQIPVQIGINTLPEELVMVLSSLTQGNFLSYRQISSADLFIYMIIDKLRVYTSHFPQEGRQAGRRIIEILEAIEHDDDDFPAYHIEQILEIIADT